MSSQSDMFASRAWWWCLWHVRFCCCRAGSGPPAHRKPFKDMAEPCTDNLWGVWQSPNWDKHLWLRVLIWFSLWGEFLLIPSPAPCTASCELQEMEHSESFVSGFKFPLVESYRISLKGTGFWILSLVINVPLPRQKQPLFDGLPTDSQVWTKMNTITSANMARKWACHTAESRAERGRKL